MSAATHTYEETGLLRFRPEKRAQAVDGMNAAMVKFRRAVYAAPIQKLPKTVDYTGEDRPSYLARAIVAGVFIRCTLSEGSVRTASSRTSNKPFGKALRFDGACVR